MKTRVLSFIVIMLMITNVLSAQDSAKAKIKEFYFSISYFSPLVVQMKYKKQIKKRLFYKIGLIDLGYNSSYGNSSTNGFADRTAEGYSAGIELGLEMRKKVFEKLSFYHGPNLNFSYSKNKFRGYNDVLQSNYGSITESYTGAVLYTFGLLMALSSHFFLSAEINPAITYNSSLSHNLPYTPYNKSYSSSFNFGVGNRVGLISLVYRK
jgi:hypothetical protein